MLSLIPMFAMIPAEIGGCTGGQRTYRMWSRTRSNMRSRSRLRTLPGSVDRVIRTRRNRRSGGYSVHTSDGGRLPDLVSFSSKLALIRDIFFHQVGPDVWREMIEKEALNKSIHPCEPCGTEAARTTYSPSTWRASRQRPR